MNAPLLEVKNLKKIFPSKKGDPLSAVENVSFSLFTGEILGLVGESGCGKSTLGKMILRLLPLTQGEIYFEGKKQERLSKKELLLFRRKVQMIFQDPYSSLNPRMTVGQILEEPLYIHKMFVGAEKKRVAELLSLVGLPPQAIHRFPHEFSGGQRQRIGIARALAIQPKLLICDEPLSALDSSIQAQIVNLLKDLQQHLHLSLLFIAHDLSMVHYLCHRVAVMYKGQIVELGPTEELFQNPLHPYTQLLFSSIPFLDPTQDRQRKLLLPDSTHSINWKG